MRQKAAVKILRWLPAMATTTFIFIVVLIPDKWVGQYPGALDVVVKDGGHSLGFFLLVVSIAFGRGWQMGKNFTILVLTGSVFLGISSELIQHYSPSREPSIQDFVLDEIGSTLGVLAVWQTNQHRPSRRKADHSALHA
jgi:hypothetical protein